MSLEFRVGVTDDLVSMVIKMFLSIPQYQGRVPPDPKERLEKMPWCLGIYEGNQCVGAVWGSNAINIIIDPVWRGRIFTRRMVKTFFDFFFARYPVATVEDSEYIEQWKRMGFREDSGVVSARREDIKW